MTKAEKAHRNAVAALGCIVCRNNGDDDTPAELHHIRSGHGMSQRATEYEIIPLCPFHHRQGGYGHAVHAGRVMWEANHGTQRELLVLVNALTGVTTDADT